MRGYRSRSLVIGSAASLVVLGWIGPAAADGGGHGGGDVLRIASLDDCEPDSFNAAFGEGTCVKNGDTTLDEFLEQLEDDGEVDGWEFDPDEATIDRGDAIVVKGIGGEFHTFTEVKKFGGGCIDELNDILGLEAVKECKDADTLFETTGVGPGDRLRVEDLEAGEHKFMCLIHPWMTAVIEVDRHH